MEMILNNQYGNRGGWLAHVIKVVSSRDKLPHVTSPSDIWTGMFTWAGSPLFTDTS